MSKFTAGEWVADDRGEYVFTRTTEGLEMVAQMRGWSYLTKHLTPDEAIEVQKANARLIAAAPEMYRLVSELAGMPAGECMIGPMIHEARGLIACIDGKEEITAHEGTE